MLGAMGLVRRGGFGGSGLVLGGVSRPLWTPAALISAGTLLAWWDVSQASSVTQSGGTISALADLSGHGITASQATSGKQPLSGSTINGKAAATFVRANSTSLGGSFAFSGASLTMASVQAITASSLNGGRVWSSVTSAGTADFNDSNAFEIEGDNGTLNMFRNSAGSGQSYTASVPFIQTSQFNGSGNIFVNGTGGNPFVNGANFGFTLFTIGDGAGTTGSRLLDGPLGEMLFTSDSSTGTRQIIEGYLAWKWGTVASLPIGHPYKSAAPTLQTPSGTLMDAQGNWLLDTGSNWPLAA